MKRYGFYKCGTLAEHPDGEYFRVDEVVEMIEDRIACYERAIETEADSGNRIGAVAATSALLGMSILLDLLRGTTTPTRANERD